MFCDYILSIPGLGDCCGMYSKIRSKNGKYFLNYPFCDNKNCPKIHPNLLEGVAPDENE